MISKAYNNNEKEEQEIRLMCPVELISFIKQNGKERGSLQNSFWKLKQIYEMFKQIRWV